MTVPYLYIMVWGVTNWAFLILCSNCTNSVDLCHFSQIITPRYFNTYLTTFLKGIMKSAMASNLWYGSFFCCFITYILSYTEKTYTWQKFVIHTPSVASVTNIRYEYVLFRAESLNQCVLKVRSPTVGKTIFHPNVSGKRAEVQFWTAFDREVQLKLVLPLCTEAEEGSGQKSKDMLNV